MWNQTVHHVWRTYGSEGPAERDYGALRATSPRTSVPCGSHRLMYRATISFATHTRSIFQIVDELSLMNIILNRRSLV